MFKKVGVFVIVMALLIASKVGAACRLDSMSKEINQHKPGLVVLESNSERLVLELATDLFIDPVVIGGETCSRLRSTGLDTLAVSGEAMLPQTGVLVGLPPEGEWQIRIVSAESRIQTLDYPIELPILTQPYQTEFPMVGASLEAVNQVDGVDSAGALIGYEEPAKIRGLRLISLWLRPFRYYPETNSLEHVYKLVVEIRFEKSEFRIPADDGWDDLLENAVINYDVARYWRVNGKSSLPVLATNPLAQVNGSLKIMIPDDGMYQLDYADLAIAGFDLTGDPGNWQLDSGGEPVSMLVVGEDDGSFDSGDYILFYGLAAQSRFTRTNVYWLAPGNGPGTRMEYRSVEPAGYPVVDTHRAAIHLEENHLYDPIHAEANGDHWYWTDLRDLVENCPQARQQYQFSISHLSGMSGITATLGLNIQGYTNGTHNLKVSINGHQVSQPIWQDHTCLDAVFSFDSAWLKDGANELELENGYCDPGGLPNGMAFNYFTLEYLANLAVGDYLEFRGYEGDWQYHINGLNDDLLLVDITDPASPILLVDWLWEDDNFRFQDSAGQVRKYLMIRLEAVKEPDFLMDQPSNLITGVNGADYVVVSFGEFIPSLAPLIELRESQGWSTSVVDVEDIYDEFNFGLLNPAALWSFFSSIDPIPDAVLLVGDGTIDYLDHLGNGWRNFIPVLPADVDPWFVETAADNRYACLDGYQIDPLPDFHLGRLAVSSPAETKDVATKIVNYETGRIGNDWSRQVLLIADNADQAGDFPGISNELYIKYLQSGFAGERIYLSEHVTEPYEFEMFGAGLDNARAAIRDNWNRGMFLINYTGHSSQSQWALENLFHRNDAADLLNLGRLPVVLSFTCYVNAFQIPLYAPLGEQLLVQPSGGAVATWGPTGGGLSTGHRYLGLGFINKLSGPNIATLGDATFSGKLAVSGSGVQWKYLIDTYVLLGDPAMTLAGGEFGSEIYLPVVQRAE